MFRKLRETVSISIGIEHQTCLVKHILLSFSAPVPNLGCLRCLVIRRKIAKRLGESSHQITKECLLDVVVNWSDSFASALKRREVVMETFCIEGCFIWSHSCTGADILRDRENTCDFCCSFVQVSVDPIGK
ncbi:unnamed protein product [Mycena citricolor]|uniref:Uncharacterized protein n=1 Tax=Mycena citricolor TaxID=2018698 RepID=A0AAD2K8C5_9AGAR|nr:unnamed protein product [Mycena citricolor]